VPNAQRSEGAAPARRGFSERRTVKGPPRIGGTVWGRP
jgi:hypothetical protein